MNLHRKLERAVVGTPILESVSNLNERNIGSRADLVKRVGQVWNTSELQKDFDVIGFQAPHVVVKRKSDGKKGSLEFGRVDDGDRLYFDFRIA